MEVVVKNNMKRMVGLDGVTGNVNVLPGVNKISLEDSKKIEAHPVVKKMVEAGDLEFIHPEAGSKKGEAGATSVSALTKLSVKEAKETIANSADATVLQEWFAQEKRKEVKTAIEKQLEALSAPAEHRSDDKKKEE